MELFRADGVLDTKRLGQLKILCIGAGSLGSFAISNLAYAWREIVIIDPELLERHNVERHVLGFSEVGQPKVEGMRRWLLDRGVPAGIITIHYGKVEEVLDEHLDADLVIVNLDSRRACDNVNAWCVANRKPALYGGVYPRGTGGQVAVIPEPTTACYLCEEHMMGGEYEGHNITDYGIDPTELVEGLRTPAPVPALRTPVSAIAADLSDLALAWAMGEPLVPQVLVHAFGSEPILQIRQGPLLKALTGFMVIMRKLGLVPNWRLKPQGGNIFTWEVKRGIVSIALRQWDQCPLHTLPMALDEI